MRNKLIVYCIAVLCLQVGSAQAQGAAQTYTSEDGAFTFIYPSDWFVDELEQLHLPMAQFISLGNVPIDERENSPDGLQLVINLPQPRAYYGMLTHQITPVDIVKGSVGEAHAIVPFEFGTPSADATPELLDLQPVDENIPVTEFSVNGYPAAQITDSSITFNLQPASMLLVLDVGNDYLVAITANSTKGGIATVRQYEAVIVAIVQSIRYTPQIAHSGNSALPQVYSSSAGVWQRGTIKFFYPANWVAFSFATQIIQNTSDYINTKALQPGQLLVTVIAPSELTSMLEPAALAVFDQCVTRKSDLTIRDFADKVSDAIAAQAKQLQSSDITVTQPEIQTVNGKGMAYFSQTQGNIENLYIMIDVGNGYIIALSAYTAPGEMKQFEAQLLNIAGTLEYTPPNCEQK